MERAQLFQRYVLAHRSVRSSFRNEDLPTWTVRLLSQAPRVRADDIPGLLVNTFAGYTASRASPAWVPEVTTKLQEFVVRLVQSGLAERESEFLHLTLLGRACGASSLSFESALRLVELIRSIKPDDTPVTELIALVQVLPEMDSVYTPLYKRNALESVRAGDVSTRYGYAVPKLLSVMSPTNTSSGNASVPRSIGIDRSALSRKLMTIYGKPVSGRGSLRRH